MLESGALLGRMCLEAMWALADAKVTTPLGPIGEVSGLIMDLKKIGKCWAVGNCWVYMPRSHVGIG